MMRSLAFLVLLVVASAGCFGGGSGSDRSPSPSMTPPPAPLVVYGPKQPNACAPPDGPALPDKNEPPAEFQVAFPYDEILINYHTSGVGKGRFIVANRDTKQEVWRNPSEDIRSQPPEICGGHAHSGNAITKAVTPGNYTVTLWYQGSVAIHADITLKSAKVAANATHQH